ncbi:hypothetical protein PAECIP111802_02690 [Paenibacillus allorhizosphaerae]|uniref:Carboxypeptidase regulatory-like domain-containing protein n=2 Tax=Paenibacillus allorhizosphaerae TaxID=2849866 RepID=A0ABN7TJW9_9BACL|nr:hypothetical protein PAECIP111802_02690 [Paenibacillus allorhizosphaerae]
MRVVTVRTQFSWAVCLIDSCTGGSPKGTISVRLEGNKHKPIAKEGGWYVFAGLTEDTYTIIAESPWYLQSRQAYVFEGRPSESSVLTIALLPSPAYPFDDNATLVRLSLKDSVGRIAPFYKITASIQDETCLKARIAGAAANKGSSQLSLAGLAGRIHVGEWLYLQEDTEDHSEVCQISSVSPDGRSCMLLEPLRRDHERGTKVFPFVQSCSDSRGEAVLFFKPVKVEAFQAQITCLLNDSRLERTVTVAVGRNNSLGVLTTN